MRRDELLLQAIATNELCVGARRKDQAIVAAKKERLIDFAQCAEPSDQRVLKC